MSSPLTIELGVKSDPVEYRYSYEWLFRIMADEGIRHVQLGSFFEMYQLDDSYFIELREAAAQHGVMISSLFTAHRELGGFFRGDVRWEQITRRNYERLIEVGALTGAAHVGSNPGAAMRDQMDLKAQGMEKYIAFMRDMMHYAHDKGVACVTMEPMSCLAEPPTLPEEMENMARELTVYHADTPGTASLGYCADISHGYADADGQVRHSNVELFEVALPYLVELHLKNTDTIFNSTFGFSEAERERGIVDLVSVRDMLYANAEVIPRDRIIAYLEIGGPKLGRDYSDCRLEEALRTSLHHVKEVFAGD